MPVASATNLIALGRKMTVRRTAPRAVAPIRRT
jgi:hypothetical protein